MTRHFLLILSIMLLVSIVMVLIHIILRQLRHRISIIKYIDGRPLYEMAYVKHSTGKVAEAYLPEGVQKVIGRVSVENNKEKAFVQILQSSLDDESPEQLFKRCGFLGEDGYIYSQPLKDGPVEKIGYLARPSEPDKPCLEGERSWRTLWLHAFLDVYKFKETDGIVAGELDDEGDIIVNPGFRRDQSSLSPEEIVDDIKRHMVLVEGGTFMMGADPDPNGTASEDGKVRGMVEQNESPRHEVTLNSFYISRFPVTQAEWTAIMGDNPSDCRDNLNYPVAPVSWLQCQEFVSRLNERTGLKFSLPTEAQWEFAARGGVLSKGTVFSGSSDFEEVGWSDYKHEVGSKQPNELGLFDMSGLVREWCSDIWGHYGEEAQTDPAGPAEDSPLVVKNPDGALCYVVRSPSGNETVTNRKGEVPTLDKSFKSYGFRLVCEQMPAEEAAKEEPKALESAKLSSMAMMVARCDKQGFGYPKAGAITSESRAGAYGLFALGWNGREYEEFYSSPRYGWKDTALLASLVYVAGYILYYLVNTSILQRPLLGLLYGAIPVLYGFYFVIWALLRSIKIERTEGGNSFQPQLDLMNKSIGQRGADICAILMCLIAIPLTISFFEFDFIPLLLAVLTGIIINKMIPGVGSPWKVKKSYSDKANNEPEQDDDGELVTGQPPAGDISCMYDWDLDYDGMNLHGNLSVRFDPDLVREERQNNPFFAQTPIKSMSVVKKMFDLLCQRRDYMERTRFLAHYIESRAAKVDLAEHIKLQFALDFIQEPNIRFVLDKNSERIQNALEYMRFPDETLFDKEGDYDCKAFFAAMLFYSMGYDVLFLYSSKHDHYAIAVEERYGWTDSIWTDPRGKHKLQHEDKPYVICETTADHFRVGDLLEGIETEDFDFREHFAQRTTGPGLQNRKYRSYDWDYEKPGSAAPIHGMVVLELNVDNINELRRQNPFNEPGERTKIQKAERMARFLSARPKYTSNLFEIARVIKGRFPEADIHRIQFALNFVSDRNIRFCPNENSDVNGLPADYVRYPDEMLLDKHGDNDSKVFFSAILLSVLGHDTVLHSYSEDGGDWTLGVACDTITFVGGAIPEGLHVLEYNDRKYLMCGMSVDGLKAGYVKKAIAQSIDDKTIEISKLDEE